MRDHCLTGLQKFALPVFSSWHSRIFGLVLFIPLSLYPLGTWVPKNVARRNMEGWLRRRRRRFRFIDFRFEAAAATLSATGSASPRPDRTSWLRDPALSLTLTHCAHEGAAGQAVVCPLLRGRSAPRGVAPKQHQGRIFLSSPAYPRARALLARPQSSRCHRGARH